MKKLFYLAILGLCTTIIISCGGSEKSAPKPKLTKTKASELAKTKTSKTVKSQENIPSEKKTEEKNKVVKQEPSMSPEQIAKGKEMIKSAKGKTKDIDSQKKYKMFCATCHGFKGDMMVNGAKDLTKSKLPLEESVAQVYFGKGVMTPYMDILKDEEIVAVCEYITTLRK